MGLVPYMGGDELIKKDIVRLLPPADIFIEGFGGSGAVSIEVARRRMYRKVIWNDKDTYLYYIWYYMKYEPDRFIPKLALMLSNLTKMTKEEWLEFKNKVVKRMLDLINREALPPFTGALVYAYILYGMSIPYEGGIMRKREKLRTVEYYINFLRRRAEWIKDIEILNRDIFELLDEYDKEGVVFYLDPPHIIKKNGYIRTGYYRISFKIKDARRFSRKLAEIKNAKILLKLSETDLPYYPEVREKYQMHVLRYISMASQKKGKKRYYFFTNYEIMRKDLLAILLYNYSSSGETV